MFVYIRRDIAGAGGGSYPEAIQNRNLIVRYNTWSCIGLETRPTVAIQLMCFFNERNRFVCTGAILRAFSAVGLVQTPVQHRGVSIVIDDARR